MRWIKSHTFRSAQHGIVFLFLLSHALAQSGQAAPSVKEPAAPMQPAPPAPPLIIIDPAHGGADSGAQLTPAIPEKDVTLMFARRLQQQLQSRGVSSTLVRNSDETITTDQRAGLANSTSASLYLCLHASSMGKGVRLYTAVLPSGDNSGPFVNWQTAQEMSLSRSQWTQQQVVASLQRMGFPARGIIAPLQPLNNIQIPALAIEVAPSSGNTLQLATPEYQDMVDAALASVIANLAPALRSHSFQNPATQPGKWAP